jgi:quinol-cytochrome oxidoreductase complex cytochrome b subunit
MALFATMLLTFLLVALVVLVHPEALLLAGEPSQIKHAKFAR